MNTADLEFRYRPDQPRGPDGRWIKDVEGAKKKALAIKAAAFKKFDQQAAKAKTKTVKEKSPRTTKEKSAKTAKEKARQAGLAAREAAEKEAFAAAGARGKAKGAALTADKVLSAYKKLVEDQGGINTVAIHDLKTSMGLKDVAPLHDFILQEQKAGRANTHPSTSTNIPQEYHDDAIDSGEKSRQGNKLLQTHVVFKTEKYL